MSTTTELADMKQYIAALDAAIVAKGGTASTTGLSGEAAAIESIPTGGGDVYPFTPPESDYGTVLIYNNGWDLKTGGSSCTVQMLNRTTFETYIESKGLTIADLTGYDMGPPAFQIKRGSTADSFKVAYEGSSPWEEEFQDQSALVNGIGVDVYAIENEWFAGYVYRVAKLDLSSWSTVVLQDNQQMKNMVYNGENSDGTAEYTINGTTYYSKQIKAFFFGTKSCQLPEYAFLAGAINLEYLSDMPSWYTTIKDNDFNNCQSLEKLVLPENATLASGGGSQFFHHMQSLKTIDVKNVATTNLGSYSLMKNQSASSMGVGGSIHTICGNPVINVLGENRQAWLTALPDDTSSEYSYRILVDGEPEES